MHCKYFIKLMENKYFLENALEWYYVLQCIGNKWQRMETVFMKTFWKPQYGGNVWSR